jgi:hypothetical protein
MVTLTAHYFIVYKVSDFFNSYSEIRLLLFYDVIFVLYVVVVVVEAVVGFGFDLDSRRRKRTVLTTIVQMLYPIHLVSLLLQLMIVLVTMPIALNYNANIHVLHGYKTMHLTNQMKASWLAHQHNIPFLQPKLICHP